MKKQYLALTMGCLFITSGVQASSEQWFLRPVVGFSMMSDFLTQAENVQGSSGATDINTDGGFNAGLGVGYFFNKKTAIELSWEYRSNESETVLPGQTFEEGNYASNLFFINGLYFFQPHSNWMPYIGAGLSWAQEVDIDLERDGVEYSYSGDGDFGYQVFAGIDFAFSKQWSAQAELRYGSMSNLTLTAETGVGQFPDMDYNTTTIQIGLIYKF